MTAILSPFVGGVTPAASPASFTPANPAQTASTTPVMMGLGATCKYTPTGTGHVLVVVTCTVDTQTSPVAITVDARYGTGTAPVNGAALTGTRLGQDTVLAPPTTAGTADTYATTALLALTAGTAYWFDLALATANASNAAVMQDVCVSLAELTS